MVSAGRGGGGGGGMFVSITVSQGRPSPLVEAAIHTDGGQIRPVTPLAITHFYFGRGEGEGQWVAVS